MAEEELERHRASQPPYAHPQELPRRSPRRRTDEQPAGEEDQNDTRETGHLARKVFTQPGLKDEDPDGPVREHDHEKDEPGDDCLDTKAHLLLTRHLRPFPGLPQSALTRADCGARATRAASGAAPCYAATSTVA